MTAYIGFGNTGSKTLYCLYQFLSRREAVVEAGSRFLIGDADTNNSVLYEVNRQRLHQAVPPRQIEVMGLSRYWGGGCGVYHVIGELLASTAVQDPEFRETLERWDAQEIVLLLSAGGGTGGGVGGYLLEFLPTLAVQAANIRLFAVLPEVDQFRRAGLEVHGPDGFQCASAGRFLVKFFGQVANARDGQSQQATSDLFLLSNSYLSSMPDRLGYQEGVERLNQYLAHAVTLMPSVADYPAANHTVAFGLGTAPRAQPGTAQPQPPLKLAADLVRSALGPVDLSRASPVGLSALPMDLDNYARRLGALLDGDDGADAAKLRAVFRQCLGVDAHLWFNPATASPSDVQAVRHGVHSQLSDLFGPNVRVDVRDGGAAQPAHVPETDQPGVKADYALLLLVDDLIIDDAFRLVTYFMQSSFAWRDGSVKDVADLTAAVLADPQSTPRSIAQALCGDGGPAENRVRLGGNARERYRPCFWGNIDDLRSKVLQSLDRSESEYEQRLLGVNHLAAGLSYFHQQLWRYR